MKTVPLSLIIASYNTPKVFISKALESVKSQTLPSSKFEVVIFDDGSTDDSSVFFNNAVKNMENVRFYRREQNLGLAATRNDCIKNSKGKYIALLDADDVLEPNALSSTLSFMITNPEVHYSYSKHKRIDTNGDFVCDRPCYPFSKKRLEHINYVGAIVCFTKEVNDKIEGFNPDIRYAQDWDHVLRASEVLNESQIMRHDEFLYQYRIHGNSISKEKFQERKQCIIRLLSEHFQRLGKDYKVFFSHTTEEKYSYFNWSTKNAKTKSACYP